MGLTFLPQDINSALDNLNFNYISEIRIRKGQPVIVEYKNEYKYLNRFGISNDSKDAICVYDLPQIINKATEGCMYNYTEQIKSGFITVQHGVRIGLAGEYVIHNGALSTIKNVTSLNIRIPHNVLKCSDFIYKELLCDSLHNTLIFSKPGYGKTTMLRDLTVSLSRTGKYNILVFDERNEISAMDGNGNGYELGDRVDVVRCYDKKHSIANAIRAMKPNLIITDELYGGEDIEAVEYAKNCGIFIIASSHICEKSVLKKFPFDYFVQLVGIGKLPLIYDKNFNSYSRSGIDNDAGNFSFGK